MPSATAGPGDVGGGDPVRGADLTQDRGLALGVGLEVLGGQLVQIDGREQQREEDCRDHHAILNAAGAAAVPHFAHLKSLP